MGVQGLWQVLEPVGKPVDINRLRGKVFAIDVSIWLHQAVKGYRDKDGNPLPHAHLLGIFFRVCKLLNYGIKPIFVFDGGVPVLKRQTMSLRKTRKIEAMDKSEISRKKLLTNYIQQELQRRTRQALPPTLRMESTLAKLSSPSKDKLRSPMKSSMNDDKDINEDLEIFRENWSGRSDDGEKFNRAISDESEDSDSSYEMQYSRDYSENFSSIMSENFDALPLETQHEILFEMQESKKNNSWGKIHQMPKDLQSFSSFQMDRLVKRRTLQKKIQTVQQEMGQRHIHVQNLDDLLKMEYDFDENKSEVIASQEGGFVLVKTKAENTGKGNQETSKDKNSNPDCTIISGGDEDNFKNNSSFEDTDMKHKPVVFSEELPSSSGKRESESERLLLAIDMLQQHDKVGNNSSPGFSTDAINAILGKIQSRLKTKEEKRNTPAEVITIDSDVSEDENEISNSNIGQLAAQCDKIKHLVSSLKLPFPDAATPDQSNSSANNFKISWVNQGGIPKISFDLSPEKRQKMTIKPELVLLDDSNDCTEIIQTSNKTAETISVIDLDEDRQLDLAMKLSMGKSEDEEDSNCCKIIFEDTSKNATTLDKIVDKHSNPLSATDGFSQQKVSRICAKFLDSVGFDGKVSVIKGSRDENSVSSCSESDFEEVTEISCPSVPSMISSPSTSNPQLINLNKDSIDSSAVVTINLSKDSLTVPPEHDIFSDIFGNDVYKNTDSPINESKTGSSSEQVNSIIERDIEIDFSDHEGTKEVDKRATVSDSESDSSFMEVNGEENARESLLLLENAKDEDDKPNEAVIILPAVSMSSSSSSSNQKITRTLGTLPSNPSVRMITADYLQAQQKLNTEQSKLQQAKGFQERIATSITDQMYIESQELLTLFGIPYVISPMEAESQCAFLDTACLTDGTLTDDSDVWLFGGRRVYKNFFSQGDKHVEFFQYADVVRVLSLDREKLVLIAMLTGSDYTEGIEGVGPVTALEIISEFPSNGDTPLEPLTKFREWWDGIQQGDIAEVVGNKTREKFKKLKLRPGFPNKAVYDAYLDPTVDSSTESFKWGNPDLDALRTYTKMKFGWDQTKCDSTLLPVIKNLKCQANEIDRQMTMDKFLIFGEKEGNSKRKLKSQRLARAVKKIKRAAPSGELKLSSSDSEASDNDLSLKQSSERKLSNKHSTKTIVRSVSESSSEHSHSTPGNSNPSVSVLKKSMPILQKVQEETNKKMNKFKAIEIFKNKKLADK